MKKFINIISWVSFAVVALTICLVSIYVASQVCYWLRCMLGLEGWWVLALVPVLIIVGVAVELFLVLGATRVRLS
ncbi:MAG: hypothetical protein IJ551_09915 [Prevotella sp.]|nr:hypothetical protein [Prevotella sp.]